MSTPRWIQPRRTLGKTLSLRSTEIADAAFLLLVRTEEGKAPAIESVLAVSGCVLNGLGVLPAHCEVCKENNRIWAVRGRFVAERTQEGEDESGDRTTPEAIVASLKRFAKYWPDPIVVEHDKRPVS